MRRLAAPAAVLAGIVGTGCGGAAAELFTVERTGSIPGARLTLRVFDDGRVRCNGGARRRLPDEQLLRAREIERELSDEVEQGLALKPGPRSVLAYRLLSRKGTVAFSDTSRGLTPALLRVPAFARAVAKDTCGLAR